jgi:hypothetical protein
MSKTYGLRLTLPGAPATPHTIPGVPGLYRPDVPTPVGDGTPVPLDRAREIAADPATYLELVEIAKRDEPAAIEAAAAAVDAATNAVATVDTTDPGTAERAEVETEAITEPTNEETA